MVFPITNTINHGAVSMRFIGLEIIKFDGYISGADNKPVGIRILDYSPVSVSSYLNIANRSRGDRGKRNSSQSKSLPEVYLISGADVCLGDELSQGCSEIILRNKRSR